MLSNLVIFNTLKVQKHCSGGGGVKFYCLGFTAMVSGEMCPAAIHRHRSSVWQESVQKKV